MSDPVTYRIEIGRMKSGKWIPSLVLPYETRADAVKDMYEASSFLKDDADVPALTQVKMFKNNTHEGVLMSYISTMHPNPTMLGNL